MFAWRIYLAARRMGLEDNGEVASWSHQNSAGRNVTITPIHSVCGTPIRVGIKQSNKRPVRYCWACERIYANPGEKDDLIPEGETARREVFAK